MLLRLSTTASVLIVALTVSAGPAQQTAPQTKDSQEATVFHSSARLVQVSVVVEDKKGNPVTGLKKEDFTVMDDGKPQQIAFFTPASQVPPQTQQQAPQRASLLPPNVFTNRFDLKGQDPPGTATIVLFDLLNTSSQDQSYVRKEVIHFLQSLKPQDHVAVYGLTNQLFILHEFTRDAADLVAAAQHLSPKELAEFDSTHTPPLDLESLGSDPQWKALENSVNNANGQIADQYNIDRAATTVGALDAIANHVSGIPGRKSLVWISGGFPIQIGSAAIGAPGYGGAPAVGDKNTANRFAGPSRLDNKLDDFVKLAADSLNRSNIAMYAIDAKGVELDPSTDASLRGHRMSNPWRDTSALTTEQDTRDSAKMLADRTGGLAFFGNNDIRRAMQRAFDDGRYAYNVAFYPNHGQWNGEYRKLKVQVKGEGLRLRYRTGYYAFADRTDPNTVVATALEQAAGSPLDATNLGMIVTGKPGGKGASGTVDLHIGIDPKQLLLRSSDGHRRGALDLFFLQRDATGVSVAAEKQHIDLNLEDKQYEYLAKAAMVLDRHLVIVPQSTEVRIVLRDAGSGSMGSVTVPSAALIASAPQTNQPN
jgi:VWFA-related protein